jgi:hypothetical protein
VGGEPAVFGGGGAWRARTFFIMFLFVSSCWFFSFDSISQAESAFAGKVSDSDEIMNKHKYLASFIYTLLQGFSPTEGPS